MQKIWDMHQGSNSHHIWEIKKFEDTFVTNTKVFEGVDLYALLANSKDRRIHRGSIAFKLNKLTRNKLIQCSTVCTVLSFIDYHGPQ